MWLGSTSNWVVKSSRSSGSGWNRVVRYTKRELAWHSSVTVLRTSRTVRCSTTSRQMTRSYEAWGDVPFGYRADRDSIADLGRRELATARAEVDPVDVDAELAEEEHQKPWPATDVEDPLGCEHLLDQLGVPGLDAPTRLEVVAIVGLAPVGGEVLLVVMAGVDRPLLEDRLLEPLDFVEERG